MARGRGKSRGQSPKPTTHSSDRGGSTRGWGRRRGRSRGQLTEDASADPDTTSRFPSKSAFPSTHLNNTEGVMVIDFEHQHLLNFPAHTNQRDTGRGKRGFNPTLSRGRGAVPHLFIQQEFVPTHSPPRGRADIVVTRGRGFRAGIGAFNPSRGASGSPTRGNPRGITRGRSIGFRNVGSSRPRLDPVETYHKSGKRPLLRPVYFVKSDQNLFEREEEILAAAAANIPTRNAGLELSPVAQKVAKVFAAEEETTTAEDDDASASEDSSITGNEPKLNKVDPPPQEVQGETTSATESLRPSTGSDPRPSTGLTTSSVVDMQSVPVAEGPAANIAGTKLKDLPIADEEDEIIVFVPPNPLIREKRPPESNETPPPIAALDQLSLSFSTGDINPLPSLGVSQIQALPRKLRLRERKIAKRGRRLAKRKQLRESCNGPPKMPRVGDSDLEWGSDGPPEAGENTDDDGHGMQVDDGMDEEAYATFVKKMIDGQNQNQVTMDDINDQMKLELEDDWVSEEDAGSGDEEQGSEEDEEASDSDTTSDDLGAIGFQTRLQRIRGKSKVEDVISTDDEGGINHEVDWVVEDDIQRILEENSSLLEGRNRRERKMFFDAIELQANDLSNRPKKKKGDHIPLELHAQWQKDREKKSDWKRQRALARNGVTLGIGMKTAKSIAPLEPRLRAFLRDLSCESITLPSLDKATRIKVHLIADCFHLKSKSIGNSKVADKVMVLTKTSRTGLVNEKQLSELLAVDREGRELPKHLLHFKRKGDKRTHSTFKHREGEIVGKQAVKIGENNIGYKLLQQMGWTEGDRIGQSGGLVVPLTAIIKNSKLGLGATR